MKKQKATLVTLSDIHIGYQPVEQVVKEFYDEEKGFFIKLAKVIEDCKKDKRKFLGVAITGDLFDHQLSLNSRHARLAIDIIHSLVELVIVNNDANIILLKGTRSHDLDQILVFEPLTTQYENKFFIADTLSVLELEGYEFLLIPEEYMKNQEEYYEEAFEGKYDFILAHGFLKFNCFSKNEVERTMPEMPIFDQEELCNVARVSIFGHDHIHKSYRDQIYYNGSYSRLCHGEEDEKGALVIHIDEKKHKVERLINELAPIFKSVSLSKIVKGELDFESCIKAILKQKKGVDFLKIKISEEVVLSNHVLVKLLTNRFNMQYKKHGIVIDAPAFNIKDGQLILLNSSEESEDENDSETSAQSIRYAFLQDSSLTIEEKIDRFIKTKHGEEKALDIDTIRDLISIQ